MIEYIRRANARLLESSLGALEGLAATQTGSRTTAEDRELMVEYSARPSLARRYLRKLCGWSRKKEILSRVKGYALAARE